MSRKLFFSFLSRWPLHFNCQLYLSVFIRLFTKKKGILNLFTLMRNPSFATVYYNIDMYVN